MVVHPRLTARSGRTRAAAAPATALAGEGTVAAAVVHQPTRVVQTVGAMALPAVVAPTDTTPALPNTHDSMIKHCAHGRARRREINDPLTAHFSVSC
uniref:Putative secreted protein n=1 Tax=Anopheles triannulatus TaxID=58253 RepID=A0A2M4B4R4_9DIPT